MYIIYKTTRYGVFSELRLTCFLLVFIASYKVPLVFKTFDKMISREFELTNMGRGAYDTTGVPKPPKPTK